MTHIQLNRQLLCKFGSPHQRSCRLCLGTCRNADTSKGRVLVGPRAPKARPQKGVSQCHEPPQHRALVVGVSSSIRNAVSSRSDRLCDDRGV